MLYAVHDSPLLFAKEIAGEANYLKYVYIILVDSDKYEK